MNIPNFVVTMGLMVRAHFRLSGDEDSTNGFNDIVLKRYFDLSIRRPL